MGHPTESGKKVPTKTKIAFALGDIFGGGSFNLINFLYPAYAALVVGLNGYLAGVLMFIARAWDAVSDPLMGQISDRTSNRRFGKRRIYILIGAPLVVVALVLMFFPWNFQSEAVRFLAVLVCYMLFSTVQTMIMIPYYSLSSEITPDYAERTKCNTIRLGFSIFSSILCVAVPGMIAKPENPQSYVTMSLIFGLIFAIPLLFTALFAKEEIHTPPQKAKVTVKDFVKPLKMKTYRQYLVMHMCVSFTFAVMSGLFFFLIDFVVKADVTAAGKNSMLGTLAAGVMLVTQIFALPFYQWLMKKKGKTFAYRFGAILWMAAALCILFVGNGTPDWCIYLLAVCMGFGICGPNLVPHTMFGDVADAGQLFFGERTEGAFTGLQHFINKVAQAVGMFLIMAVIAAFGFVSKDLSAGIIPTTQPERAQWAIKIVMAAAPIVVMSVGIALSLRYRVGEKKQKEILALIEAKDSLSAEELQQKKAEVLKDL